MLPQAVHALIERKTDSGQPNVLKFGLAVTVIHVLVLLLLLGKGI